MRAGRRSVVTICTAATQRIVEATLICLLASSPLLSGCVTELDAATVPEVEQDEEAPELRTADTSRGLPGEPRQTNREVLAQLGVETDLGARTDDEGEPLADGLNPLGARIAMLTRVAELGAIGMPSPLGGEAPYFILDDPASGDENVPARNLLSPPADSAWTESRHRAAIGADVDGDGSEETLVAYLNETSGRLMLRILGDAGAEFEESSLALLVGLESLSLEGYSALGAPAIDLAAADLDGDGAAEVALAFGPLSTMFVFDDQNQGFRAIGDYAMMPAVREETHLLRVATGDTEGDGRQEVVITDSSIVRDSPTSASTSSLSTYAVLSMDEGALVLRAEDYILTADLHMGNAAPTVGDFDGDGLPEIAFGGRDISAAHSGQCALVIAEDGRGMGPGRQAGEPFAVRPRDVARFACTSAGTDVVSGDFDGDYDDEGVFQGGIYDLASDGLALATSGDIAAIVGIGLYYASTMVVADFDGSEDGRDELAILSFETATLRGSLEILGIGSDDQLGRVVAYSAPTAFAGLEAGEAPVLFDANVDDDSVVVEYSGQRELMFSEPVVMAVLASAPYYDDVTHAEGATVWAELEESSSEHTLNVGGSASFSLGVAVEPEAPLIGSLGFAASVVVTTTFSFDFNRAWGHSVTETIEYENPEGQDLVVFSATPYDYYYYTILSSPDAEDVGQPFAIHVPRRTAIHHLDRESYNELNGESADVDEAILSHEIGDPWSYPRSAERDAALDEARTRGGLAVATSRTATCSGGNASVGLSVELAGTDSYSWGGSVSVAVETEVEIGKQVKAIAGAAFEAHVGYEYSISTTHGIGFGGVVGDMDPDEWDADLSFDWGLFAYEQSLGSQSFPVVTYWVE